MKQLKQLALTLIVGATILPAFSVENRINEQARKLVDEGKLTEALALEQKAAKENPNSPSPHLGMTAIYQRLGESDKALAEAQLAVKLAPASGNAHYNLGTVYYSRRQLADALSEYQKAITYGNNDVHSQRAAAQCLLESGRIPEALSKLEALSKKYPQDKDVWVNLGRAYMMYGDVAEAGQAAERAVQLGPDFYPAIILKAHVKLQGAQFAAARELAMKALTLNPKYPVTYLVLGQLASFNLDKPEEALAVINAARKNTENEPQIFLILGKIFSEVSATKTVAQNPTLARKWREVTELALRTAADQSPTSLQANYLVGKMMLERRRPVDALPYAERALAIAPNNPQVQQLYKAASVAKYDLIGNFLHWWQTTFQGK